MVTHSNVRVDFSFRIKEVFRDSEWLALSFSREEALALVSRAFFGFLPNKELRFEIARKALAVIA